MATRRVLLIEHDPAEAYLYALLLTRAGYDVVTTTGAQHALDTLAADTAIDAVQADLALPGLNGAELVRVLEQRHAGLPLVLLSVLRPAEWGLDSARYGRTYLQKPFDRGELLAALRRACDGAASPFALDSHRPPGSRVAGDNFKPHFGQRAVSNTGA